MGRAVAHSAMNAKDPKLVDPQERSQNPSGTSSSDFIARLNQSAANLPATRTQWHPQQASNLSQWTQGWHQDLWVKGPWPIFLPTPYFFIGQITHKESCLIGRNMRRSFDRKSSGHRCRAYIMTIATIIVCSRQLISRAPFAGNANR